MIYWLLGIVGWVACGVASYFAGRKVWLLGVALPWTRGDRRFMLCISLLGPCNLIAMLVVWINDRSDNDRPASW